MIGLILVLILVAIVSKGGRDFLRGLITLLFGVMLLLVGCSIV